MPNTEQLLYQTKKSSDGRFSMKTLFLKIPQYSRENACLKFLKTRILKKICYRLLLNEVIVWNFVLQKYYNMELNITKIPVAFKPEL